MVAGGNRRDTPEVTVAVLCARDGRLLCIEEWNHGRLVLNQPAGHLEPGESLVEAAVRETREEAGWQVRVTALVGIYQWTSNHSGVRYLRVAFAAEALDEIPDAVLDTGIERALWLTPDALHVQAERHRSPLVWRAVTDYLGGQRAPLSLLHADP